MNIFNIFNKKEIKTEQQMLSNKDLNVCAIKFINNKVVPALRSWETEDSYVFNPTDVSANLIYAINISNR